MDYPLSTPLTLASISSEEAGGRREPGGTELSSGLALSIFSISSPSTSPTLCFCPSPAALSPFARCGMGALSLTRLLTRLLFSSSN